MSTTPNLGMTLLVESQSLKVVTVNADLNIIDTWAVNGPFPAGKLSIAGQATGDMLYASSPTVFARLPIGTSGQVLLVTGGIPTWTTAGGGIGTVTSITAGAGLTGGVITTSGTIAIDFTQSPTWSGTHTFSNAIAFAAAQTFNAVKLTIPSQATGDILYASSGSAWARLGAGSNGQFVKQASGIPSWASLACSDLASGTLAVARIPVVTSALTVLTDAATIATDASLGNIFRVTLGGNRTLGNPTNPTDGQKCIWEVIQDGTGTRTLAYDTKFAFGTDIASATLTTTASKRDFIGAVYSATPDKWYIIAFVKGY
jgi:hypothetical protein